MIHNPAKWLFWKWAFVIFLSLGTNPLWAAESSSPSVPPGISPRICTINTYIEKLAEKIIDDPQSIEHDFRGIEKVLSCPVCNPDDSHDRQEDQSWYSKLYHDVLGNAKERGYSGAKIAEYPDDKNPRIIKKFEINNPDNKKTAEEKKAHALRELLYSLIALHKYRDLNKQLKMVEIYDAVICKDSLSFVMEKALGYPIDYWMDKDERKNAIKAYAKYLATFHVAQRKKIEGQAQGEYLRHAATFWHKLSEQQNKGFKEQKGIKLFRLHIGEQIKDHLKLSHLESDTIILKLSEDDQKKCVGFIKRIADLFEGCSSYIYRALKRGAPESKYWTTITHGDAHRQNFFYNNAEVSGLEKDSLERITMIDYASSVETYGSIGDPAEDVGRFLGSLWDWASEQPPKEGDMYGSISKLQQTFLKKYYKILKTNRLFSEDFENIFIENCNFYKLRYYRTIFNSPDSVKEDGPKVELLKYWMKEMEQSPQSDFAKTLEGNLEKAKQFKQSKKIPKKQEHLRKWKRIQESEQVAHNLQERQWVDFFIESVPKESKDSYLTQVWKKLHTSGTATLTDAPKPQVPIAGMGGIGKTSLALEYTRESLESGAYNLIWWLPSENPVFSLKREYEEILRLVGLPNLIPQDLKPEEAIKKMKTDIQNFCSPEQRWLLIYDNAQNHQSLKDMIPKNENIHVLITSRTQQWKGASSLPGLQEFSPEDSEAYLLAATGLKDSKHNRGIARSLSKELGYLPLGLSMAASYINLIWDGCPIDAYVFEEYLHDFERNPFTHEDPYERLVGKTYDMLEEELSRELEVDEEGFSAEGVGKYARNIMVWSSYLNPDEISENIFIETENDEKKTKKAVKKLRKLSLLKKVGENSFSVHRLIQKVIRDKEIKNHRTNTLLNVSERIETLFYKHVADDGKFGNILTFLPHVISLLDHYPKQEEKQEMQKFSLLWIGRILHAWYEYCDTLWKYESQHTTFTETKDLLEEIFKEGKELPKIFKKECSEPEAPEAMDLISHNGMYHRISCVLGLILRIR